MKGRILRLLITAIFVFSLIPVTVLQQASPVEAAPGWTQSPGMTINDKYIIDSCVIKDDATHYEMWYTHLNFDISLSDLFFDMNSMGLGTVLSDLQANNFDAFLNDLHGINSTSLWDILSHVRTIIGYATSSNGNDWTFVNSNVLGTTGDIFQSVGFPSVIRIDATHYQMWYTSLQSTLNQGGLQTIFTNLGSATPSVRRGAFDSLLNSTKTVIKYADSTDGHTLWSHVTTALDVTTGGGVWNLFDSVGAPSVILDGGTYKMWYTRLSTTFNGGNLSDILTEIAAHTISMSDLTGILNNSALVIGYAEDTAHGGSTFGVVNPQVLPGASLSPIGIRQSVADPCVIKTPDGSYEMWYTNGVTNLNAVGLSNVFTQIKSLHLPDVLTSLWGGSLANFLHTLGNLSFTGLRDALTGTSAVIGHATSSVSGGGIVWSVQNSSELVGAATTPWSSIGGPSVVESPVQAEMWFTQGIPELHFQNIFDWVMGNAVSLGYASTPALTSIDISAPASSVASGGTVQFTATGTFSDSSTADLTSAPGIVWHSSNPTKASISVTGLATGIDVGATDISATYGSLTSIHTRTLNVTSATLQSIVVSAFYTSIPLGKIQQYVATGHYSDMSTADITNLVTWTIGGSNPVVATINATTGLAQSVAAGGPLTVTATLGISGTSSLTVTAAVFDYLRITPDNPSVAAGDTVQLSAIAYNTNGTWVDHTADATWGSNNGNATVSNTGGTKGLVTGHTASTTATITASVTGTPYTSGGGTDATLVTVGPARVTALRITDVSPHVAAGLTTSSLSLVVDNTTPATNVTLASNAAGVTWASLNTAVATVSADGHVTGLVQGTVTIRASYLGYTATVTFTVDNPNLTGITVTPANTEIPVGAGNIQYTATGVYSDGINRVLPNSINTGVGWSVTAGATISASNGLLTPGGSATSVTVTAIVGSVHGSTGLTITAATLDSITISATSGLSVPKGETRQLIATGHFSDLSSADITSLITSWSSGTPANVSVSSGGLVTASGAATSTGLIQAVYGGKTGSATVTVAAPDLMSIAISPVGPSIAKGRTQQFTANGTYSDGSTGDITTSVTWSSDTTTIATIGAHTGLASSAAATAIGDTGITASFTRTDSVVITSTTNLMTVTPAVLTSIAVTSSTVTSVAAGGTLNLVAKGTYSDGTTNVVITNSVVWSSANSAFASVDATGLLISHIPGTVTITATSNGIPGSISITVNPATVSSVSVDPAGAVIVAGNTRTFRAIANYSDGTKTDVTTSANWASDSAHATVGLHTGVVTGFSAGTANITATFNAVPSSAISVTVTDPTAVVTGISVTATSLSINAGETTQFTATGHYSIGPDANLTDMVTLSSSDNTIATIIPGGLVTSYRPGSATITASYGGQSGTAVLTVNAAVLTSISVTPVNPQITDISGATTTFNFTATGVYSDGSTADLTNTAGIWGSSVGGVATIVSGTGVATIAGAGSTSITAITGGKTGTSTLTVLADTVAPVVTITSPTPGFTTSDKNLTITGNIDDILAATKQLILNNGTPVTLTIDGSGNFSAGVLLNTGVNTIQVKAVDVAGNIGQSGTVTVKVDARKPSITITSPLDGTLTNNSTVTISGTVALTGSTFSQVNVIVNGISTPATVTAGGFNTTATLSNGNNIICVTANDPAHPTDTDYLGTSGSRTVTLDTTPPVVSINSPINSSYVGTAGLVVSGTVDDPDVTTANLILNSDPPLPVSVTDGRFSQNITLQPGANTISVRATDAAGNTSPANVKTVTLDISKPNVALTAPVNNLRTNAAGQIISGTVNDPSITSVALYVNGVLYTIPVIGGTFSEVKTLNQGSNTIEAQATNAASNTGSSGVYNVIVDTVSPVLTIGLTDPTASIEITVVSNKALSVAPIVDVNGTPVVTTQSGINTYTGTFAVTPGDYTVTASGIDSAGNKGTATASFTKETITVTGTTPYPVTSQDTTLQVQTNGSVTGDISVNTTSDNPSGNVGNPGGATLGAGAFVEIIASSEIQNNLNQIYIQVNYDPAQLPSGTDETTLKLYLWDVASGTWQVVPGSGVNTTDKYIFGTVNHLSTYGGFGSATVVVPPVVTPPAGGTTVTTPGTTSLTGNILFSGQFINQVIARSDDGVASITIPANTMGLTAAGAGLTQITMVKMTAPPAGPANNTEVGAVYDFGPNGATFSPAITISIPYSVSQIPAGADAGKIQIAFRDASGNWTKLNSVVDTVNHVVTALTTHFTTYALLVPTAPAAFTASTLTVSPAEAKPGDQVTITVKVSNTGDLSGTYTVNLKINNATVDSKDITLADGVNGVVTFTTTQTKDGTYSVGIDSQTGQFVVNAPVLTGVVTPTTPVVPASFTVSNLLVTPSAVDINGTVTINVQVSNSGDTPGTYEVKLRINNVDVTSKTVSVDSKSTKTVTFTTSEDKAGTYSVNVGGLTGDFTVAPAVITTTPPPPPPHPTNWPLIIGIIGGIVVVAAVVAVVMVSRKKK